MRDFLTWLRSLDLDRYAQVFADNDVDLDVLRLLSEKDLQELGVSLGHRKKLLKAIAELADSLTETEGEKGKRKKGEGEVVSSQFSGAGSLQPPASQTPNPELRTSQPPAAERRQLTVLFCDLADSTALSARLDPEELREVVQQYQHTCAEVVQQYDDHIAQYLGDGILVYFGYPIAHEDDAARAVRSGLAVVEALQQVPLLQRHGVQVRIGIHTGLVVVGEIGGGEKRENLALGETPNLAARLQGMAPVDSVVVSEQVRRLAGGAFDYVDLGAQSVKGIAQPTRVYRIAGVSNATSRFEAATQAGLTPLVGREHEIAMLLERWQLAQDGEGQVGLLSGEPGIGKSRILSALVEQLAEQGVSTLRFQCSPYHVNSALYPIIDNFDRTLKFARDETPESKLDKLEALLVTHYGRPKQDVRFIAAMLSIPCEERWR